MNTVADESVDKSIVTILRQNQINIIYVAEIDPSISDTRVLETAFEKNMILLTSDKDFGELVFKNKAENHGVILLRSTGLSNTQRSVLAKEVLLVLKKNVRNCFVVITFDKVRIHRL